MPIYEYKCENEHVFDIMQRMSDDPLTKCVECGAPVKKVLHPVGISFKGSGFYSTDYKNGSKKSEPANANAKTNGDTTTKSESSDGGSTKAETTKTEKAAKKD